MYIRTWFFPCNCVYCDIAFYFIFYQMEINNPELVNKAVSIDYIAVSSYNV